MAKSSTNQYAPKVTSGYMEILRNARGKITFAQLKKHPRLDPGTVSRVFPTKVTRAHAAPVVAVERMRLALEELTGAEIPPPVVAIENDDQWAWIQAGEILRRERPELFRDLLKDAMGVAAPTLLARRRERELQKKLHKLRRP